AGGYVFQIEMTFRASRSLARVREQPITFRDRRVGQSKMSRRIVAEALVVVVALRLEELRTRLAGGAHFRRRRSRPDTTALPLEIPPAIDASPAGEGR
ncbi:MAG TPA: hypothetical protein VGQ64_02275, partial [Candidatus Limnocylindrales bacterium]|nr:hypothetical protein [Candidatus Limnocylindrales bacterium]